MTDKISCGLAGRLDGRQEKSARAALFTAVQRMINKDTILVVDGMNYIKGYRYQLYCAAREMQVRVCTVRTLHLLFLCKRLIAAEQRCLSLQSPKTVESGIPVELKVRMQTSTALLRRSNSIIIQFELTARNHQAR